MEKINQGNENSTGQLGESLEGEYSGATLSPPAFQFADSGSETPPDGPPVQKQDDPLKVDRGQVTFDAEGNDTKNSTWYSRHIHWPGTDNSGVTIGRGYDMGNRTEAGIKAHMQAAGIGGQQANLLAASAGKKGASAKKYVADYRDQIGDITQEQQKKLFEIVYVEYEAKAKGRATKHGAYAQREEDKPFMLTPEQYDALHPTIKELLVDLTYRGDYRSFGHTAYEKVNPILKEEISDKEKMEKLKTLLNNYKATLKKGHFMIHRTEARIALLDSGISGGGDVDLKAEETSEPKDTTASSDTPADSGVEVTEEDNVAAAENDYASATVWDRHSERRMVGMHPSVAASARALINIADKEHGIKLRIPPQGGFRSFAEQDELKARGASTVGGGYSFHNYGMAVDVVEIKDGAALWTNPRWDTIASIGKNLGFEWGGDWKSFVDKPHFQMTFGYTTRQLLAREKDEAGFVDLGDRDDNALMATDSAPLGATAGNESEETSTTQDGNSSRVPTGRLIGEDVGFGGVNHPDDVEAVRAKLAAIGVLTSANAAEYAGTDEAAMGKLIRYYQRRIFRNTEDGLMSAGGATETRLINGVKGNDLTPDPAASSGETTVEEAPEPKDTTVSSDTAAGSANEVTEEDNTTAPDNDYASATVWDKHSERRMVGMHPSVAASARALINIADKEHGIKLRIPPQGGFRSFAEQDELKARGASTVGGGYSFHNYGMAVDVVEIKDGAALWKNPRWDTIASIGKNLGFEWGGDWKSFVDKPHFQMTFGYTTRQLRARDKDQAGFVDLGDRDDNALMATDSAPVGTSQGAAEGSESEETSTTQDTNSGRVPNGRLIGEDVGFGGVNHPDDVDAVRAKLAAIGVLTSANAAEYAGTDEAGMGKLIRYYQRRIFRNTEDGLMSAGGATESRLISGVKGNDPAPDPTTSSSAPTESVRPVARPVTSNTSTPAGPDFASIADRVFRAMDGWGTDEDAVYAALAELNKNGAHIAEFKSVYRQKYDKDVVTQIRSEFSNTMLWGNELDKALSYLNAGTAKKKEPAAPKSEASGSDDFATIDNVMERDDWRTQNPNPTAANQQYEDNESGWTACKYISEKMVYRAIYEDLPADFKRSQVLEAPGEYDYIVGGTGLGQFLSVQKEDKSEFKNIIPKKHKQSTFNTAGTANIAIDYLSGYLAQGIPVVAGVDHTFNRSLSKADGKTSSKNTAGYNEGTTDHFVTIVGQGVDDQNRRYFKWFDPGTQHRNNATSDENRLVEVSPNRFVGSQPWGDKTYTLTMVVLFQKDISTYKDYVDQNISDLRSLKEDFANKTGDFAE
ncbi:MAG: M15 family metallopeptidase [Bacteroidota bacterium]